MRRFMVLLVLGFAVCGSGVQASVRSAKRLLVADTVLAAGHFHAEVEVEQTPACFPWADRMSGCYGRAVTSYTRDVRLRVGVVPIGVPLSAYSDLGDPSRVRFEGHEKGARLVLQGCDKGNKWTAEFFIEDRRIVRRKLSLTDFPDVGWEETVYSQDDD